MNKIRVLIGISILLMLGVIELQLYQQQAGIAAIWSRLDDLGTQLDDLQDQLENNADNSDPSAREMRPAPDNLPGLGV